jgi:predicted heme/steroid binding protein
MKIKTLVIAAMMVVAALALAGCTTGTTPAATATPAATEAPVATATPAATEAPVATATPAATEAPAGAATPAATEAAEAAAPAQLELTADELAAYDGKDGKPAYVAVDGVIYDVTDVPQWANGTHNGNTAGKDLTDVIKSAPHGESVLAKLTVVGKLK